MLIRHDNGPLESAICQKSKTYRQKDIPLVFEKKVRVINRNPEQNVVPKQVTTGVPMRNTKSYLGLQRHTRPDG